MSQFGAIGVPDARREADASGLPCPIVTTASPQSENTCNKVSGAAHKSARKLSENAAAFVRQVGIDQVLFVCLTFGGGKQGPTMRWALKCFHSLLTNVLADLFPGGGFRVIERGEKNGRVHFHLLVDACCDVRTGVNWSELKAGDGRSLNANCRRIYGKLQGVLKAYGFGWKITCEPVRSEAEAVACYCSKYVAKHIGRRREDDKGVRLWAAFGRAKGVGPVQSVRFSWVSPRARLWRAQVQRFAEKNKCSDLAALRARFGVRWAYHRRWEIMTIEPPSVVIGWTKDGETPLTLYDVWMHDRIVVSRLAAAGGGFTSGEAFSSLYNDFPLKVDYEVPRWSGDRRSVPDFSDIGDVTVVMNTSDGGVAVVSG